MKAIVLAGGTGTRLFPLTSVVSKQLLPVWDKPLIYYPLSTVMQLGLRDILIISTSESRRLFEQLFGDGSQLGLAICYATQSSPDGIAQALTLGSHFLDGDSAALVLGDNVFVGGYPGVDAWPSPQWTTQSDHARIFAYRMRDASRYGVVRLSASGKPLEIVEKPQQARDALAIPGLYLFPPDVVEMVRTLRPSDRGEFEISSLNQVFLEAGRLDVSLLPRGMAWLDAGTFESLRDASEYVRVIEQRQGLKVGCIEEVSWRNGWISDDELSRLATDLLASGYGSYLLQLLADTTER